MNLGPLLHRVLRDRRGTTAIEYALIASGISIFILGAINTLGGKIVTTFYERIGTLF